ncbi:MAG: ATP-binding protein [Synergistaceae bacterium]|nr:ATP-binding protein [Synergistaceae bacterium]
MEDTPLKGSEELTIDARMEDLDEMMAFVDGHLEEYGCPAKVQIQIEVAVEEIFVNIASYAYTPETGPATVRMRIEDDVAVITFIDSGVPYDPLAKPDPDVSLSAEERPIGGLGIYLVKKSMDSVSYNYESGKNVLQLEKRLK